MPLDNFFVNNLDPQALRFKNKINSNRNLVDSDEEFFATDLICEGPIEGLVDSRGNVLKYVYSDNASDIALARGIYYNDVPLLDTKTNKFNFTSVGFKIFYGDCFNDASRELPSTVFRYSESIFLNDSDYSVAQNRNGFYCFASDRDGTCSEYLIGSGNQDLENYISDNYSLDELRTRFENAKTTCNPFTHKIKNKYCDFLKVQLKIDSLYYVGGSGAQSWYLNFVVEISEDVSSRKFYCFCSLNVLTKGNYLFEVPFNLNLDSNNKNSYYVKIYPLDKKVDPRDKDGRTRNFSISSIVECVKKRGFFGYPYTAIVRSSASSRHFSKDPNRTFDLKLMKIKVPSNYDPESKDYSGNWNGKFDSFLRWTDNPAWVFYDICTNSRYGVGNKDVLEKDINKWQLYKIAKYCDELVKTNEPHKYIEDTFFTFDNSNYIYISKINSNGGYSVERSLSDIKAIYPPVVNSLGNTGKNGGEQNSIIFLYDLKDESENDINFNYKKIIWSIEEGYFDDNKNFTSVNDNSGSFFRIKLINDFGPRKAFEQDPYGKILDSFFQIINYPDSSITNADSLASAITASEKNTEGGAKNHILEFYRTYGSGNSLYSEYITSIINEPIFTEDYSALKVFGKCKSRILDYRDPLEARFSMNVLIDNETECLKLLNDLTSVFRGLVYYKNDFITPTVDVGKSVSYFFNNTNVKDGVFSYSSGAIDGMYTVVKVLYKDRFQNFNEEIEIIEDSELIRDYGIIIKEILGFGITSRSQARAVGEWTVLTNRFENQSVSFVSDLQGLILNPGDVVKIEDVYKNNSTLQGRVTSVNRVEGYITVDRKLNLNLTGQKISFLGANDYVRLRSIENSSELVDLDRTSIFELEIDRIENDTNRVYLSTFYNFELFNKISATTPFIINQINSNEDDNLYKIVSISEQDANEYSVFCIKYDSSKYKKLDSGTLSDASSLNENTISFSNFKSLEEVDLTGMTGSDSYYDVVPVKIKNINFYAFDYSFTEENSSLSIDAVNNYAFMNLYFSKIYNYISRQASLNDDYYKKIKEVLDYGGGFLCKLSLRNESIKFIVKTSDISDKKIFLGRFSGVSNIISSVSGIRIYLFNNDNKFVSV